MMRLAVDAVIENEGQVLLLHYHDPQIGHYVGFPGGGVELNESIHAAVRREVWEETGATVVVGRLLLVNEYDPALYDNHLYSDQRELRLLFHCTLQAGSDFSEPSLPEPEQIGIGWLAIADLPQAPLFPRIGARLFDLLTAKHGQDLFNTDL